MLNRKLIAKYALPDYLICYNNAHLYSQYMAHNLKVAKFIDQFALHAFLCHVLVSVLKLPKKLSFKLLYHFQTWSYHLEL